MSDKEHLIRSSLPNRSINLPWLNVYFFILLAYTHPLLDINQQKNKSNGSDFSLNYYQNRRKCTLYLLFCAFTSLWVHQLRQSLFISYLIQCYCEIALKLCRSKYYFLFQLNCDNFYCTICNVMVTAPFLKRHIMSEVHMHELQKAAARALNYTPSWLINVLRWKYFNPYEFLYRLQRTKVRPWVEVEHLRRLSTWKITELDQLSWEREAWHDFLFQGYDNTIYSYTKNHCLSWYSYILSEYLSILSLSRLSYRRSQRTLQISSF